VLLCLRAYVVAGRPKQAFKSLNRFEGWSDLVRSALTWLGQGDAVATMDGPGTSDTETDELAALLLGLCSAFGPGEFTAAKALRQTSLKELFDLVCPARSGVGHDSRRLGRALQRGIGRVVGSLRLELAGRPNNLNSYRVVEVGNGRGGSGGTPPFNTCAHACACACAHAHEKEKTLPRLDRQIPQLPPLPSDADGGVALAGPASVVAFIAGAIERRAGGRLFASAAYAKYTASCADACGEDVFAAAMREAGFPRATYHGLDHYADATLWEVMHDTEPGSAEKGSDAPDAPWEVLDDGRGVL
jgi:hypothetical protein